MKTRNHKANEAATTARGQEPQRPQAADECNQPARYSQRWVKEGITKGETQNFPPRQPGP